MATNAEQNPQHLSQIELYDQFPDEESARRWLEEQRWPDGVRCARCDGERVSEVPNRNPQPYWCGDCRKYFSVRTNTKLEASNLPLRKWVIAIYQVCSNRKGVSSIQLQRDLKITQRTAWYLAHRLRDGLEMIDHPFEGEVEVDESYIGGLEKNKHASKRLRAGRGTAGKFPVIGMRERDTGRVIATPIDSVDARTLKRFVEQYTDPDAIIYADENPSYNGVNRRLDTVSHGRGEYVRGDVYTNGIESFWNEVKKSYGGVHHWWSRKHLARYVRYSAWRHNTAQLGTLDRMILMTQCLFSGPLSYRELTQGPLYRSPWVTMQGRLDL